MTKADVIVIGAGIAGLTAARFLAQKQIDVLVLEGANRIGGRVHSKLENGFAIDTGAQFLSSNYGVVPKLIKQLGIQNQLVEVSQYSAIVRDGKPRRIKSTDPFSLVSGGILSLGSFTHFAYTVGLERVKTNALPLEDYSAWHELDDVDAREWCLKNLGEETYNYLIEPTFEGLYFQSPSGSSRAFATAVSMFPARGQTIYGLKGGNGSLTAALAQNLNIKTDTVVKRMGEEGQGITVETESGELFMAQKVILAVTASKASELFASANDLERKILGTKYSSTINIVYGFSQPVGGLAKQGIYGMWVPDKERQNIGAIAIESNKNRTPSAKGEVLNVMLCGQSGVALMNQTDEQVLKAVTPEVERYFPNAGRNASFQNIYRWAEAEPLSPVGRSRNLHAYRSDRSPRTVWLAGDYMSMPWTDGAAESALWTAQQIAAQFKR